MDCEAVRIPLTRGKFAVVDAQDAEMLQQYRWFYLSSGYAARHVVGGKGRKMMLMHRELMGATAAELVDHANHDGLDNRRANLRICSKAENQRNQRRNSKNTTGHKGVSYDKSRGKFAAGIQVDGRHITLGRFDVIEDAVSAYEAAARKYHGEFNYEHSAVSVPPVSDHATLPTATRPQFSSQYRGVSWRKRDAKWVVNLEVDGKSKHIGMYTDEREAAHAYNVAAIEHHGNNAKLNLISD